MNRDHGYQPIDNDQPNRNDDDEFNFRQKASSVTQNIQELKKLTSSIRAGVEKIGTSKDNIDFLENLQLQQKQANELAHNIRQDLKTLTALRASNVFDQRIRDTQVDKLTNGFSIVLREFQNIQRNAASRERATVSAALKHAENVPLIPDFASQTMQAQEQAQEFIPIEEIEERQKAIKKIEEDIMGVNDIMKDLAVLIHEQGEYVDSIESHVEVTHSQVQAANIQLEKARNFQSKSRKKQCCLILTLIIIIAIISLIIYLKTKK